MPLDQQELTWIYNFYRLGRTTNEGTDPSVIWLHLLENIIGAFDACSGCLAEIQNSKGGLRIQAGIGLPEGVVGSEVAAGSGVLGLVASEGKPRLLNGNLSDNQNLADRVPQRTRPAPWSAMCWPLIVESKVLGVISVNRSREMEAFSEKDLERGERLIEFIAVAVENTQLNLKSAKHVAELREMNQKQVLWRKAQEWLNEAQSELETTGNLKLFCIQAAYQVKTLLCADWGALLVEGKTHSDLSIFSSNENLGVASNLRMRYTNGLPISEETEQSDVFRVLSSKADEGPLLNAIGVPIRMPGSMRGVLMVGNEALPPSFHVNEEMFLSTFSMGVQRVMERIQLLNSLRRTNQALKEEREELLSEIKQLKTARH